MLNPEHQGKGWQQVWSWQHHAEMQKQANHAPTVLTGVGRLVCISCPLNMGILALFSAPNWLIEVFARLKGCQLAKQTLCCPLSFPSQLGQRPSQGDRNLFFVLGSELMLSHWLGHREGQLAVSLHSDSSAVFPVVSNHPPKWKNPSCFSHGLQNQHPSCQCHCFNKLELVKKKNKVVFPKVKGESVVEKQ